MNRRLISTIAAATCALAVASPASAATQTKDDAPDDVPFNYLGSRFDLRHATLNVTPETVDVDLGFGDEIDVFNAVYFFFDTNKDGKSDYALRAIEAGSNSGKVRWTLMTTPDSTAGCQRANGPGNSQYTGQELVPETEVPVTTTSDGWGFKASFPTSLISGAQTFDWAAYALTFDIFHNRFDYMPDGANYDVNRLNPVNTVKDYCDTNGDGVYGDSDTDDTGPDTGDNEESQSGSVPLVMAEGFTFPDAGDTPPPSGGGGAGGGTPSGGAGPGANWPHTTTDTTRSAAMPKVTGLRSDKARDKVLGALGFADLELKEVNLAKPPKGTGFGDVVEQTPKAGTPVTAGIGALPKVTLEIYAGPRPVGSKDCLDFLAKDVKGMEMAAARDLLTKAGCKINYDFKLGSGDKEVVTKVTPRAKDRVDLSVQLPADAKKQDLFLNVRENPNQLSFDAPRPQDKYAGFNLLSSTDQRNCVTIQVVDRGGRLVQGANVQIDTSDVGGSTDTRVAPTRDKGETTVCVPLSKAGKVDFVAWAVGANDVAIYGGHSFNVVDGEKMKNGTIWNTSSGRALEKKSGRWVEVKRKNKVRAAAAGDYGPLVNWLITLFTGNNPSAVQTLSEPSVGAGTKLNTLCGGTAGSCPAILAIGSKPVGLGLPTLISVTKGQAVAAGGANVVSAGGANVVAAGGLNLVSGASNGVVSAGGANVVSAGGANVVSAGGANVVSAGGANVLVVPGSGVIAPGGANLISIGNKLISDNGLGLISDNGLGLISDNGLG